MAGGGVGHRRGGAAVTGWMLSGELQRRVSCDGDWLTRLRGKNKEGWSVKEHNWCVVWA